MQNIDEQIVGKSSWILNVQMLEYRRRSTSPACSVDIHKPEVEAHSALTAIFIQRHFLTQALTD